MNEDTNGPMQSNRIAQGEQDSMTRHCWEVLPSDPDDETDLGYTLSEWEAFETLDDSTQVMFLPSDEELLKDSAFVVAEERVVVSLENNC